MDRPADEHRLEFRVLLHGALGLVDGIFLTVGLELGPGRSHQVNVQLLRQVEQVEEDVGHFRGDGCFLFVGQIAALGFGQPLEVFEEFGGLYGEGRGEVFGGVELGPVAGF